VATRLDDVTPAVQPPAATGVLAFTLRRSTFFTIALAAGMAGMAALAWKQWRELVVLRAAAGATWGQADLEARLADLRKQNFELRTALSAREMKDRPATAAGTDGVEPKLKPGPDDTALLQHIAALAGGAKDAGSKRDDDLELLATMSELPEFQKLLALERRGAVDVQYAALFKKLKLTPDELARVQSLLADRQSALSDALMGARAQGLTGKEARQVANEVARATQKEINATLKEVLGSPRFNQLQNYERTAPQRATVEHLATRLSYTGAPLTPRQQDQLVQVLATQNAPRTDENGAVIANRKGRVKNQPAATVAPLPGTVAGLGLGSSNGSTVISPGAFNAAQTFLSPRQMSALQRMQQEQEAQQTIGNLLRNGTVSPAPVKIKAAKPKG
jgi:hypothetical protein